MTEDDPETYLNDTQIEGAHEGTTNQIMTCQCPGQREKEPLDDDDAFYSVLNAEANLAVNTCFALEHPDEFDETITELYEMTLRMKEKHSPAKVRACLFDMDGWAQ